MAPSRTGSSTHGQGIANDPHANAVATKAEDAAAEDAAAEARAKELKAMSVHNAKAQMEAGAKYSLRCTDRSNPFRLARRLAKDLFGIPGGLQQR